MPTHEFDVCIIGQGIAGTALGWALRWEGLRIAVVDRGDAQSASRVAAGLITPITGQRFVKSKRFDEFEVTASTFYRRGETETGRRFFHETSMLRLFADANERDTFAQKPADGLGNSVRSTTPHLDAAAFDATHGGFEMTGARLDVAGFLDASREAFSGGETVFTAEIDPVADLELKNDSVEIAKLGMRCRRVVFCQGFAAAGNRWFRGVPFDAAKGEILKVRIPGLNETRVIHRGVWLAQVEGDVYRVGATYDRDDLCASPTSSGRDELCTRLRQFLQLPFEVVGHEAAVRPIIAGKQPLLGFHPEFPQLGYFNGLASKGALQAPWLALHFAEVIAGRQKLIPEYDVAQRVDFPECNV